MNKIYLKIRNAALVAAVAAAGTAVADAYTADDLCGKIVGQVFFQNRALGAGLPAVANDGYFTKDGNYLMLSRFRDSYNVKFELINGNKLRVVEGSYQNINGYSEQIRVIVPLYSRYYDGFSFRDSGSTDFEGTITEVGDGLGTLKVVLESSGNDYLQFRRYSTWGANMGTANDHLHTYEKVELYIYPSNAAMTFVDGDGYTQTQDMQIDVASPVNNKAKILLRNWSQGGGGLGYNYNWSNISGIPSTSDYIDNLYYNYTENGGVIGELDYNNNTITIEPQTINAYATFFMEYMGYNGYYLFNWQYYNPGNVNLCGEWLEGESQPTVGKENITGTFTGGLNHTGNTMWHTDCGGDLKTISGLNIDLGQWTLYKDFDNSDSSLSGIMNSAQSSSLVVGNDVTFNASIPAEDIIITHNPATDYEEEIENGQKVKKYRFRVNLTVKDWVNTDNVESVDLYYIEGLHNHYSTVTHSEGRKVASTTNLTGEWKTNFLVKATPVTDNQGNVLWEDANHIMLNKKFSFYLKANYKPGASAAPGMKTAAPLDDTFHALVSKTGDITTAVDLNEATGLNVEDVEGGIIVHAEGNAAVEVYNVGGMLVAAGNTNETIATDATGVLLVRVSGKVFKIMK